MVEDAILHLREPVVGLIERGRCVLDVEIVLSALRPGEFQNPVEIGPNHCGLGRDRTQLFEAIEFAFRPFTGLRGKGSGHDRCREIRPLILGVGPELGVNRLQLFLEVDLTVIRIELHPDLSIQLLFDSQDLQFPHKDLSQ